VEEIAISKFKATCLAILDEVRKTGKHVVITRLGTPIAEVIPYSPQNRVPRLGGGIGTIEILGDIVGPISEESDWEAAQAPVEVESDDRPALKSK
jgi:prevent-host-death family protein